ncbi:MAG: COX15/CtaA family protein [Acidimicrobiia bacterium]|nr:COX15/CtaA family protein [Acidimicrobiia bacterium]
MRYVTSPSTSAAPTRDPITRWLLMVAFLIVLIVLVGGFVRLSRAGLSIVEWDLVTGIVPPISEAAWQDSFAEYQQSPEYQLINEGMTLSEYQRIFYYEWGHRLLGRIAGFLVIAPLAWFMWRRRLTFAEALPYWGVVAMFGIQGALGWIMVSSGLRDRPLVSHFRLTIHLLAAVLLLGVVVWMALDRIRAARAPDDEAPVTATAYRLTWILMGTLVLQLAYGGLVAGLKAGYLSDTWPGMFGQLVPGGLLSRYEPWWRNLYEALGSHWVHRWLAFVVAAFAVAVFARIVRDRTQGRARNASLWLLVAVAGQIILGIYVVLLGVPKWIALAHQGLAIVMFCLLVVIAHQAYAERHPRRMVLR